MERPWSPIEMQASLNETRRFQLFELDDALQDRLEHRMPFEVARQEQLVSALRGMKPGVLAILYYERVGAGPNMSFRRHYAIIINCDGEATSRFEASALLWWSQHIVMQLSRAWESGYDNSANTPRNRL